MARRPEGRPLMPGLEKLAEKYGIASPGRPRLSERPEGDVTGAKRRAPRSPNGTTVKRFSIAYDGPALADDGMELLDLAPAMMAMGQLLQSANAHANGGRAKLNVMVHPLRRGSMLIDLQTIVHGIPATAALGGMVTRAHDLWKFVFGNKGLLEVLKGLRGEKAATKADEQGRIVIRIENSPDARVLVVDPTVAKMVLDENDRRSAAAVVRPLMREGVEALKRIDGASEATIAEKKDLRAFENPDHRHEPPDSSESVSESETVIVPRMQATYSGPRWRVRPQGADLDFYVAITDEQFLNDYIAGNVDLRPGYGLKVRLRTRTRQDERGMMTVEYTATKVLGVEKGIRGEQTSLLGEPEGESGR